MTMPYRELPRPEVDGPAAEHPGPVANAAAFFPRHHPSAAFAETLGQTAVGLGPITGVLAILLAELVLEEVAQANGLYLPATPAKRGRGLAWAGTLGWSAILLAWAASASPLIAGVLVAGAALVAVGCRAWTAAPRPARAIADLGRRAPWRYWGTLAAVAVATVAGTTARLAAAERARLAQAETCAREDGLARDATEKGAFDAARAHLETARAACVGPALTAISDLQASIPKLEREAEERRARDAAEAEARRRAQVVAEFESRAPDITATIERARSAGKAGRWLDARAALEETSSMLGGFAKEDVGDAPHWASLNEALEHARKDLASGIARAEQAEAAAAEAKRRREEAEAEAAQRREEALQRMRDAAEQAASRTLICGDGTSSGCSCAGSHRGCCSHHGGVARCGD